MNVYAWVLLGALAVAAAADWRAVARGQRDLEAIAKPAYLVVLIAFAWLLHADVVDYGRYLLVGLVFSLIGDVALLGRTKVHFAGGLAAFLAAHLCYIAAMRRVPGVGPLWVPMLLMLLVVLTVLWFGVRPVLRHDWREGSLVIGYAVVIGLMTIVAWATGHVVLALGATLFCASDLLIGYQRYERVLPGGRVAIHVTYHVGQLLIVWGMLRC